jgi:hypothetical protein
LIEFKRKNEAVRSTTPAVPQSKKFVLCILQKFGISVVLF